MHPIPATMIHSCTPGGFGAFACPQIRYAPKKNPRILATRGHQASISCLRSCRGSGVDTHVAQSVGLALHTYEVYARSDIRPQAAQPKLRGLAHDYLPQTGHGDEPRCAYRIAARLSCSAGEAFAGLPVPPTEFHVP